MKKALSRTVAAAAVSLTPAAAWACGGFFCNNQTMDQSGEEILFGVDPAAGTVRAVIRIFYQGDAEDFAWVLPVPSVPELGVSSDEVFQVLRARTQPTFQVTWADPEGDCWWGPWWPSPEAGAGGGGSAGGDGSSNGVQVLDSGQVGDFEYQIVKSDSGEELFDWLNDNDFVQPPASRQLIDHYVVQGMVFVALKLQQNAGAGDITPIVLDFEEQAPCVPLVLTQIAAQPDMPVRLYVASTARSVPTNWFGVEVNQKKIDWVNGGSNYEALVSAAVDEAAGHGFVTEYAGSSALLDGALYADGQYDLESLKALDDPAAWVMALSGQFQGTPALLNVLREFVPLPKAAIDAGIDEQSFYNWPEQYDEYYALINFDPAAATAALDDRIVQPRKDAQELLDRFPYLTRMYTKVSPEEMNRDPLFAFNTGLGDVAKDHTATGQVICNGTEVGDISITLPDGVTELHPVIPDWWGGPAGYEADDVSGEPSASTISLLPTQGDEYVVSDRSLIDYIDAQLGMKTADQLIAELTGSSGEGGGEGGGEEGGEGGGEESGGSNGGNNPGEAGSEGAGGGSANPLPGGSNGTDEPAAGGAASGEAATSSGGGCSAGAPSHSGAAGFLAALIALGWVRRRR